MYNVNLICTRHKEHGNCNSVELQKMIDSISPDIIFEELSYPNFCKSYQEERLITLETNAIKMHLQNHRIWHIPVDTYPRPDSYDENVAYMFDRIINNNRISESRDLRSIFNQQLHLENQYGFSFLNSNENDKLFEKIDKITEEVLNILNDDRLFRD